MTTHTPALYGHVSFETAGEHGSMDVPVVSPAMSVEQIRRSMIGRRYGSATHLAVCEDGKFRGILRIEDLLAASDDAIVIDLMDADAPVVAPGVDQEVAVWHAVEREESALAVVDSERRFLGIIPAHRLLAVLLAEHDEDLSRMGGFLRDTSSARKASQERVQRRFGHRVPWLLLGLAGALLAADLVGWFEAKLQDNVMLAFFIPGIVYLADAVGTQTETVVVRGLSVGVPMRRMWRREILTGLAIGIAIALVTFPLILLRWGDHQVALAVSLSLLIACSTATLAAMASPWLLLSFKCDPAFGSGPLATVLQDLASMLIYFLVAAHLVG